MIDFLGWMIFYVSFSKPNGMLLGGFAQDL
jgi:hypothetical protein